MQGCVALGTSNGIVGQEPLKKSSVMQGCVALGASDGVEKERLNQQKNLGRKHVYGVFG
jgi:hypothetical protein